jgi:hypothetical protein
MFSLSTGVPGSGKTLHVIYLLAHLKDTLYLDDGTKRKVYYANIPELSSKLDWIKLKNPFEYHLEIEKGSIVVIDECQKFFPARLAKERIPDSLKFIETHRHLGLDIFFITQHPNLIDIHARRLTGQHFHLKRNFGAKFAVIYKANECLTDPQDFRQLRKCEKQTFRYPKNLFGLYKSAEFHTHKFKIPKRIYFVIILFFCFIGFIFYGIKTFRDVSNSSSTNELEENNSSSINVSSSQNDFLDQFIPKFQNVPASAPAYNENWAVLSIPIVSSCIGSKSKCRCYSQQSTIVNVTNEFCRNVLKHGLSFDHTLIDNRIDIKKNKK